MNWTNNDIAGKANASHTHVKADITDLVTGGLTMDILYQNHKTQTFSAQSSTNIVFNVNKDVSSYKMLLFTIGCETVSSASTVPSYLNVANSICIPVISSITIQSLYSSVTASSSNIRYAVVCPYLTNLIIDSVMGSISSGSIFSTTHISCVMCVYGFK